LDCGGGRGGGMTGVGLGDESGGDSGS
jgi:hypothetical protein